MVPRVRVGIDCKGKNLLEVSNWSVLNLIVVIIFTTVCIHWDSLNWILNYTYNKAEIRTRCHVVLNYHGKINKNSSFPSHPSSHPLPLLCLAPCHSSGKPLSTVLTTPCIYCLIIMEFAVLSWPTNIWHPLTFSYNIILTLLMPSFAMLIHLIITG